MRILRWFQSESELAFNKVKQFFMKKHFCFLILFILSKRKRLSQLSFPKNISWMTGKKHHGRFPYHSFFNALSNKSINNLFCKSRIFFWYQFQEMMFILIRKVWKTLYQNFETIREIVFPVNTFSFSYGASAPRAPQNGFALLLPILQDDRKDREQWHFHQFSVFPNHVKTLHRKKMMSKATPILRKTVESERSRCQREMEVFSAKWEKRAFQYQYSLCIFKINGIHFVWHGVTANLSFFELLPKNPREIYPHKSQEASRKMVLIRTKRWDISAKKIVRFNLWHDSSTKVPKRSQTIRRFEANLPVEKDEMRIIVSTAPASFPKILVLQADVFGVEDE